MRSLNTATFSVFVGLLCSTVCFAQASGPTPRQSPAAKTAISKACSDQANAQGLHGKKREAFRAKC
jgi:hypothetical protein